MAVWCMCFFARSGVCVCTVYNWEKVLEEDQEQGGTWKQKGRGMTEALAQTCSKCQSFSTKIAHSDAYLCPLSYPRSPCSSASDRLISRSPLFLLHTYPSLQSPPSLALPWKCAIQGRFLIMILCSPWQIFEQNGNRPGFSSVHPFRKLLHCIAAAQLQC